MSDAASTGALFALSSELASVVERAGPSVVRVDDGTRLTASGVIWAADGLVLTTSHGVERDEKVAVELGSGTRLDAAVVGRDPDTDLALLRVAASGLPVLAAAGEAEVKVGHLALALARPGEAGLHATLGIVSARFDTERNGRPGYILHTDAVLYPGFSGGALVDVQGRAVGITNLMFGRGKGVAVGMPVAAMVAESLLAHGKVQRGFLGVTTQPVAIPPALAEKLATRQDRAVLVVQVEPGSPAEAGGVMLGDVLLRVGEGAVQDPEELRRELRSRAAGVTVQLTVLRGGEQRELVVTLGSR